MGNLRFKTASLRSHLSSEKKPIKQTRILFSSKIHGFFGVWPETKYFFYSIPVNIESRPAVQMKPHFLSTKIRLNLIFELERLEFFNNFNFKFIILLPSFFRSKLSLWFCISLEIMHQTWTYVNTHAKVLLQGKQA